MSAIDSAVDRHLVPVEIDNVAPFFTREPLLGAASSGRTCMNPKKGKKIAE
jgi:hypothetical protein